MRNALVMLIVLFASTFLFTGDTVAQPKGSMKMDRQRFMDHDRFMNHERLIDQLNLTDEQKDKIETLRLQHKKEMVDLKAELEKREIELAEARNKDNISRNEVIPSVENINKIKNEIALKVANHRMDIYELLTDEQKEIWKDKKHGFGMGPGKMLRHKRFHDGW
jgi:Spy/CpxP family protein refolding chaperone